MTSSTEIPADCKWYGAKAIPRRGLRFRSTNALKESLELSRLLAWFSMAIRELYFSANSS